MKNHTTKIILLILLTPLLINAQVSIKTIKPNLDVTKQQTLQPKVALVLSGGGARGIATIGVLKSFEKHKIPINLVVGTSMGSLIGGLYSMGYSADELHDMVNNTNWEDLLSLSDEAKRQDMYVDQKIAKDKSVIVLRFNGLKPVIPKAFSSGQKLFSFLNVATLKAPYQPNPSFDDLKIPFRSVTTDLITGKKLILDKGDMTETLRASLAVPLLYSAIQKDTLQLLDGGLVDNLPVDVAIKNNADIIIAVDVVSPLRPKDKLNDPWEIADQITTIMMQEATKISRSKASIVITPQIGNHLSSDFTNTDSLIILGQIAADNLIDSIQQLIYAKYLQTYCSNDSSIYKNIKFEYSNNLPKNIIDTIKYFSNKNIVENVQLQKLINTIYDDGSYSSVEANIYQKNDSSIIKIQTTLNNIINDFEIVGNTIFSDDSLKNIFNPLKAKPKNLNVLKNYLEKLLLKYKNTGYVLARILNVSFNDSTRVCSITLNEGKIDKIDVRGTEKTRDWVIRREMPFEKGDLLTSTQLSQGISNLFGTNYFYHVHLSTNYEGKKNQLNVITINATEKNTELIRLGFRADNERNIQPSIDIRDENLFGVGAEIGFFLGGGERNQTFLTEIKANRIFNSYMSFGLKGFTFARDIKNYSTIHISQNHFKQELLGEYKEMRHGGTVSFGAQLERLGNFSIEGRLEKHKVYNIINNSILNQRYNISSVKIGSIIDNQNKYPFPNSGLLINMFYETALVKIPDAIGFTKLFFSYNNYSEINKTNSIYTRLNIGIADATLPISEQFSLGGQNNFFGLPEDCERGIQLFVASIGYQYKAPFTIFFDTYFKVRYDIGSVWSKPEEVRLLDLKHGIGLTFGLDTPIGPFEFSISRAFYINKLFSNHPVTFGPMTYYFSIGYPIFGILRN